MRTLAVLLWAAMTANGATWYVDSAAGDDSRAGDSPSAAWRTLGRANSVAFEAGDRLLLKSGSVFHEGLRVTRSGLSVDRYGSGAMPRIEAGGVAEDGVLLYNVSNVEVRGLEVTNRGESPGVRRGVHIFLENFGTASHVVVSELYIHDVNGTNQRKDNGGIIFRTAGGTIPSRFDGLTIERNLIRAVDRSAIAAQSSHARRNHWFPSLHVVIQDNYAEDIGGDGIVPWATDGARIEHNIVRHANRRAGNDNAGIWPWSTDNSVFEWNEAAFTHTTRDGQGFDSDYNSRGTLFQYNYSHDNEGGFLLICSPGKCDPAENVGNIGTVARRNLSYNDGSRIFHISAVEDTRIEENAIYVPAGRDVQMVLFSDWSGWAKDTRFVRNRFYVQGTARYGHGTGKNPDGTYPLSEGWGPATGVEWQGNLFYGNHVPMPTGTDQKADPRVPAVSRKWNSPEFDFTHPERFDAFLASHRAWLRELLEAEFGRLP